MGVSKISPYSLGSISPELENFRDEVTNLLNYGNQATTVVTALPSWRANPGQRVLFRPSSGGMTEYVYASSAWFSTWSI